MCSINVFILLFFLLVPPLLWKGHWITSCLKDNLHLFAYFLVWFVRKHSYSLSSVESNTDRGTLSYFIFKKKKRKIFQTIDESHFSTFLGNNDNVQLFCRGKERASFIAKTRAVSTLSAKTQAYIPSVKTPTGLHPSHVSVLWC